jgi:hypothetical protein
VLSETKTLSNLKRGGANPLAWKAQGVVMALPGRGRGLKNMYLIAIAWLYVATLYALFDTTVIGGILTFLFYGVFPLALVLWLLGTPERRRRRNVQATAKDETHDETERPVDQ